MRKKIKLLMHCELEYPEKLEPHIGKIIGQLNTRLPPLESGLFRLTYQSVEIDPTEERK